MQQYKAPNVMAAIIRCTYNLLILVLSIMFSEVTLLPFIYFTLFLLGRCFYPPQKSLAHGHTSYGLGFNPTTSCIPDRLLSHWATREYQQGGTSDKRGTAFSAATLLNIAVLWASNVYLLSAILLSSQGFLQKQPPECSIFCCFWSRPGCLGKPH